MFPPIVSSSASSSEAEPSDDETTSGGGTGRNVEPTQVFFNVEEESGSGRAKGLQPGADALTATTTAAAESAVADFMLPKAATESLPGGGSKRNGVHSVLFQDEPEEIRPPPVKRRIREPGAHISFDDAEILSFSNESKFVISETVAVPRGGDYFTYGTVASSDKFGAMVLLGGSPPMRKPLPLVLVGKLNESLFASSAARKRRSEAAMDVGRELAQRACERGMVLMRSANEVADFLKREEEQPTIIEGNQPFLNPTIYRLCHFVFKHLISRYQQELLKLAQHIMEPPPPAVLRTDRDCQTTDPGAAEEADAVQSTLPSDPDRFPRPACGNGPACGAAHSLFGPPEAAAGRLTVGRPAASAGPAAEGDSAIVSEASSPPLTPPKQLLKSKEEVSTRVTPCSPSARPTSSAVRQEGESPGEHAHRYRNLIERQNEAWALQAQALQYQIQSQQQMWKAIAELMARDVDR